jgi:hypothetical protein
VILLCRPLATLSFTLSRIELAEPAHSFAVISCGPHWGMTPVVANSDEPWFNWQVCILALSAYSAVQMTVVLSRLRGSSMKCDM